MSFSQIIILFFIALIVFLAIDLLWLGVIAKDYYRKQLKKYIVDEFDLKPAALFYVLFIVGLLFFALVPAVKEESLGIAMGRGAAYGFFTYVTYCLTNLATLKNWPATLVPIDIAWGTFLAFAVSTISYSLYFVIT